MCYLNNPAESEIDRFVAGYQTCVFELTEKQWRSNNYLPIKIYSDAPPGVYAFIEFCQTVNKQFCNTQLFQVGTEVRARYDPELAIRIIFENDDSEDQTFQIEITNEKTDGTEDGTEGSKASASSGSAQLLGAATASSLIFAILSII